MFSLDQVQHVYVSSARRGFMAVADMPMCVDNCSGSSGNHVIVGIKQVERFDGEWRYAAPDAPPQYWLRKAWEEAIALSGAEPWRVYRLDASQVAAHLDAGAFVDDIRGFANRLEPWQPIKLDANGDMDGNEQPAIAAAWERVDGWRAIRQDGGWAADGSRCNADESTLEFSPRHFDPLPGTWASVREAIGAVDAQRPWD